MRRAFAALALAACGVSVDPAELPSIDGYHDWSHITVTGAVPGHGDTSRVIYVNAAARTYPHGGRYPLGSVFVKETFEKSGALHEISIMRKVGDGAPVPTQEGWLFTDLAGGDEVQKSFCFTTCHRSGPFDFGWFDHGD